MSLEFLLPLSGYMLVYVVCVYIAIFSIMFDASAREWALRCMPAGGGILIGFFGFQADLDLVGMFAPYAGLLLMGVLCLQKERAVTIAQATEHVLVSEPVYTRYPPTPPEHASAAVSGLAGSQRFPGRNAAEYDVPYPFLDENGLVDLSVLDGIGDAQAEARELARYGQHIRLVPDDD